MSRYAYLTLIFQIRGCGDVQNMDRKASGTWSEWSMSCRWMLETVLIPDIHWCPEHGQVFCFCAQHQRLYSRIHCPCSRYHCPYSGHQFNWKIVNRNCPSAWPKYGQWKLSYSGHQKLMYDRTWVWFGGSADFRVLHCWQMDKILVWTSHTFSSSGQPLCEACSVVMMKLLRISSLQPLITQ